MQLKVLDYACACFGVLHAAQKVAKVVLVLYSFYGRMRFLFDICHASVLHKKDSRAKARGKFCLPPDISVPSF